MTVGLTLDIVGVCLLFIGSLKWKTENNKAVLKEEITFDSGLTKPKMSLYFERADIILLFFGFSCLLTAEICNI